MCLLLRSVTTLDEAFLFEVYASTREEEIAAWGWDAARCGEFLRMQYDARRRGYQGQHPDADDRVILRGEEAVGRMLVNRAGDHIRLIDIAVLPRYRNMGIGTRLIRELIAEGRVSGRPLRLHVAKDNRAARLYRRLGFSVVREDAIYCEMECTSAAPAAPEGATCWKS